MASTETAPLTGQLRRKPRDQRTMGIWLLSYKLSHRNQTQTPNIPEYILVTERMSSWTIKSTLFFKIILNVKKVCLDSKS